MTNHTIHGNLTKAVEIGTSENGTRYAHFTVASDRGRTENSPTDFFRVSAIGDWVEELRDLTKGTFVKVSAYLKVGAEYNGQRQIEIIARRVERAATGAAA
jgi:single-stranded DNA-binding protein